tara:strand:+ start:130 stop:492 length:363 start_codon:yes stop_codon:yes gene_type:complete
MCGDTQCPSCGPAQGNNRCPNCGKWDDEGGCDDPVACQKACEEMDRKETEMWENLWKEEAEYAKEMEKNPPKIEVNCSKCGKIDEADTEFVNIEEDFQGADVLTFICPDCHTEQKSRRFG